MDTCSPLIPPSASALERTVALLRVLGNADRLKLLVALRTEEFCVAELAARLNIQQPTLSQQLTVLRHRQLVSTRRAGKHIYYRLGRHMEKPLDLALELARAV